MTEDSWPAAALVVDAVGLRCPMPVLELARRVTAAGLPDGSEVEVISDDPAAAADVPARAGPNAAGEARDRAGTINRGWSKLFAGGSTTAAQNLSHETDRERHASHRGAGPPTTNGHESKRISL